MRVCMWMSCFLYLGVPHEVQPRLLYLHVSGIEKYNSACWSLREGRMPAETRKGGTDITFITLSRSSFYSTSNIQGESCGTFTKVIISFKVQHNLCLLWHYDYLFVHTAALGNAPARLYFYTFIQLYSKILNFNVVSINKKLMLFVSLFFIV